MSACPLPCREPGTAEPHQEGDQKLAGQVATRGCGGESWDLCERCHISTGEVQGADHRLGWAQVGPSSIVWRVLGSCSSSCWRWRLAGWWGCGYRVVRAVPCRHTCPFPPVVSGTFFPPHEGSHWAAGCCSGSQVLLPDSCPLFCLRLIVCAVLCCLVLLVVLCNIFGLLLGPLGLKEDVLPTKRSSLSNAGGNFFMA